MSAPIEQSVASILKSGEALQSFVIDELALLKLLDKAWEPVGKKILKQVSSVIDFKKGTYNREAGITLGMWLTDDMYDETLEKIWKKIEKKVGKIIAKSYDRGIEEEGENPFTLKKLKCEKAIHTRKSVSSVYAARRTQAVHILQDMVWQSFTSFAREVAIPDFHGTIQKLERINDLWQTYERQNGRPLSEDAREILRYEQARRLRIEALSKAQRQLIDRLHESLTHNKYNKMMSNLATARAHHFGFLDWAQENGILYYKIVATLDEKTCASCAAMDGKIFSVKDALAYKDKFLAAQGDKEQLKRDCPFLTQNDIDNIHSRSFDQ